MPLVAPLTIPADDRTMPAPRAWPAKALARKLWDDGTPPMPAVVLRAGAAVEKPPPDLPMRAIGIPGVPIPVAWPRDGPSRCIGIPGAPPGPCA